MEPPSQGPPAEIYRARKTRRRKHLHGRQKTLLWAAALAIVLLLPMVWIYSLYRQRLAESPRQPDPANRLALVAAVNKLIAQTGKDVPLSDLVVDSATVHERDGKLYLSGTIQNRSSHAYPRVHIIFDTLDRHHNPANVIEGDVSGLPPQKTTPFELGPVDPLVRSFSVRSIEPVQ